MTRRAGALTALAAGVLATTATAAAAPPQGFQADAAFASSYAGRGVTSVPATTQRTSCYAPEVLYFGSLSADQGFPDGGSTLCSGAADTGESLGPFSTQDVANAPLRVKDHSESDIDVDPTDRAHLIGFTKWFVNAEGYNHLTGFYESYDGGRTWPNQGHLPGYEGWTDNSDPVGAFDPWGNYYAVVLPYMFDYDSTGRHRVLTPSVNPSRPRNVVGVAVRPARSTAATAWLFTRGAGLDVIVSTGRTLDKQWLVIDRYRSSPHFGRVYVFWAQGVGDESLRIYGSHADAHRDGTHTPWSTPQRLVRTTVRAGENGALPQVAPDGTVWITTNLAQGGEAGSDYTLSNRLMWSRDGGRTWRGGAVFLRHTIVGYANTFFRSAFGESLGVGRRKVRGSYPLYFVFEAPTAAGTTLFLTASFDGGRHWRARVQVNDNRGPGEALQPSLTVAPNGVVAVTFYDRRLPCATSDGPDAAAAGIVFDPSAPFGRLNYCLNTAIQFYRPGLRPIGHNIRLSPQTWDPQLSAARFACICSRASFIGDYFGIDADSHWVYTSSVTTFNAAGENPGFHQQQLVSRIGLPSAR